MRSQSLLAALGGLKELGDPRGFDIAYKALSDLSLPRWRLSSIPPSWDYRHVATDPRGQKAFEMLKVKFKDDANAMIAVNQYETQFKEAVKK